MKINEAVILLGGMGTRLLPYTKTISKEMLPIYDVPMVFKLVQEAYLSGIEKIIFVVTKHNKYLIEKFLQNDYYLDNFLKDKPDKLALLNDVNKIIKKLKFEYVYQNLKGTYGALYSARKKIQNDNFIVMYGDDLTTENVTKELITNFKKDAKMYTTIIKKNYHDLPMVGVVQIKENYLDNLVPKKDINEGYEMIGRMLLNKKIFTVKNYLFKHANNEYYLPYALLKLKDEVKVYNYCGKYFNIGDKLGFIKASIYYAIKDEKQQEELANFLKEIM